MTFSEEHQTNACQFDVLSSAKAALPLSFFLGYFLFVWVISPKLWLICGFTIKTSLKRKKYKKRELTVGK